MCLHLDKSLTILITNFLLFKIPWCFLFQNLSGKYRVTNFIENTDQFNYLKNSKIENQNIKYENGVYIFYDKPRRVNLLFSDADAKDFYFPNGNFNDKTKIFEVLSYIKNEKYNENGEKYMMPITELPSSETQGIKKLDVQGNSFGNLPPLQNGYITRTDLEKELYNILIDKERHPIITLSGRGGIGKTWLTLEILYKLAEEGRFPFIIWFSARDIDLLPDGPKPVKAHIQSIKGISTEFTNLYSVFEKKNDEISEEDFINSKMQRNDEGDILFVFDNFETVKSPKELYNWINTYIRLPNKVLITSRISNFKGDYEIEVSGMNENESKILIDRTIDEFQIGSLITSEYIQDIIEYSYGHPYVMKILLGETAKKRKPVNIKITISSSENILNALFERTFNNLSPAAKRIFLTLCSWRSPISFLALEAVLLSRTDEPINISDAVKELQYSSFIESNYVEKEEEKIISVPLVAFEYGKNKYKTYTYKSTIEADLEILRLFGPIQQTSIDDGFKPIIIKLIRNVREKSNYNEELLEPFISMLEYIASKYPYTWLLLGDLYKEFNLKQKTIDAFNHYIESGEVNEDINQKVWNRLADAYKEKKEYEKEMYALVELSQLNNISYYIISESANRINSIFKNIPLNINQDEKKIIINKLVTIMEKRINEATADDCSRLGWLYLRINNESKAKEIANLGLIKDPENVYCLNLLERLKISNSI
jgi:hypothetical protein